MIHDQMADYYDFLSLRGYKRAHEYHYQKENCMYRKLHRYYLNHYNKLIMEEQIDNPHVIPESWYKYMRQEVDVNTKRNSVKLGIDKWIEWETDTKEELSNAYNNLISMGEIAGALFVSDLLKEVDCELKYAHRKQLELNAVDYNIEYILQEQKRIHDKYKRKLIEIK